MRKTRIPLTHLVFLRTRVFFIPLVGLTINFYNILFVETPRKFITAINLFNNICRCTLSDEELEKKKGDTKPQAEDDLNAQLNPDSEDDSELEEDSLSKGGLLLKDMLKQNDDSSDDEDEDDEDQTTSAVLLQGTQDIYLA